MITMNSPKVLNTFLLAVALVAMPVHALAQSDPPDSPAPTIASHSTSTRALTELTPLGRRRQRSERVTLFGPGGSATVFITGVKLAPGEGANSLRLYAEDWAGRKYKFPVISARPVPGRDWILAVTFKLEDEIGYWKAPTPDGDLLIAVTWRGMQSNRVRIAFGAAGGRIKDDAGAVPTPIPNSAPTDPAESETNLAGDARWSRNATRLLQQATFGPTVALEDRVRTLGMRGWVDSQLKMPFSEYDSTYPNLPLMPYDSNIGCPASAPPHCMRDNYWHYQMPNWFFRQAFYGEQQLRHRMAWTLSQIWVVSARSGSHASWMKHYHRVLSRNAFGNWRQLMEEMTLNPAMGNYLDMMRSTKWEPNENYAREVLQLFNVGLFMLNRDGSLKLDAQGQRIPTYSQQTVENFAKVFTGWSLCETTGCPGRALGAPNFIDSMVVANPSNHDTGGKTLLSYPDVVNQEIAPCLNCSGDQVVSYANNSLERALDNIYNHPNVAPFVSKLLIQHFVTSDPSPAYVERVADVFEQNRTNPTQMKEVIRAVLLDAEARGSVKTDPRYGKLREPVQLMTNIFRHLDVSSADLTGESDGNVSWNMERLGQGAFNAPTVFNYYQPDFMAPGTNLLGPEFGLFTTGTAVGRANLVNQFLEWGIQADNDWNPRGTRLDLSELDAVLAADPTGNTLLDELNGRMLHGMMTERMRSGILSAMNALPTSERRERLKTALYLVASSLQFQVQR